MKGFNRKLLIPVSILIIIFVCGYLLFELSKSRTFQFFGGLTSRIDTDQKIVALTFDDAPSLYSDEVLKTLKDKDVKATFFVIGKAIEDYPKEGKNIVLMGHELGNHSYSHQRILFKSLSFIDSEIQETNTLIRATGYQGEITSRPPNGKKLLLLPWYLKEHKIKTIMWDVEPDTYADQMGEGQEKVKFIVDYTLKHTLPGSIILMHPFCKTCESDRKALVEIIDGLKKEGYRFVTISELLTYQ